MVLNSVLAFLKMLPPSISSSDKHYKAVLVLSRGVYKTRFISGEIPEFLNYGSRTLKLKLVLWDCERKLENGYTFLKLKALVYR